MRGVRVLLVGGLLVTVLVAGFVSFYASGAPDGLERVAGDHGIAEEEQDHAFGDSPLGDYGVGGVDNERLSVGLAGVVGVTVTLAAGGGLFWVLRRRGTDPDPDG